MGSKSDTASAGKPLLKRPWVVVAGALLIVGGLVLGAHLWIGHAVRRTLQREVASATGGVCRIEVKHVGFNLFTRSVRLGGITLSSDTAALAVRGGKLEDFSLAIDRLTVRGIHYRHNEEGRVLLLGELTLLSPVVSFVRNDGRAPRQAAADTTLKQAAGQGLKERLAEVFTQVTVGRFALERGRVDYCEYRDGVRLCHDLDGLNIRADHFTFRVADDSTGGVFLSGDLRTSIVGLTYMLDHGAVRFEVDTLRVDTKARLLAVEGLHLLPQMPKSTFASVVPGHPDWTQADIAAITCTGVDFRALQEQKRVSVDSVNIRKGTLQSYKNRQVAQTPRIKPLFYQSLHKLPLSLDIRRVRFDSIDVSYQELAPDGTLPGTVTFDRLGGDVYGLTNVGAPDRSDFTIEAQGWLMNQGRVNATFRLPVDSADNRFEVSGHLDAMRMAPLNQVTEPLANLRLLSGQIAGMDFHIAGDALRSTVRLTLRYDDLSVALLKKRDGKFRERKFLSTLLDDLVIRHDNPDGNGLRVGEGTVERDPHRSQFNYLWKSLLPGVKATVVGRAKADRRGSGTRRGSR